MPIVNVGQTKIKISTSNIKIGQIVKNNVTSSVRNVWLDGLNRATKYAADRFVRMIEESTVIQALNSEYESDTSGKDLPAEFGLDRDIAKNEIVPAIIETSKDIFDLETGTGGDIRPRTLFGVVNIGINSDYANILLRRVPGSTYESVNKKGDSTPIPWMRWLLLGEAENDEYGILYTHSYTSRSTSAFMNEYVKKGWFWNAEILGGYGNDFITDAIRNPKNAAILKSSILRGIQEAFASSTRLSAKTKGGITITGA
jgi:hypothetical protein